MKSQPAARPDSVAPPCGSPGTAQASAAACDDVSDDISAPAEDCDDSDFPTLAPLGKDAIVPYDAQQAFRLEEQLAREKAELGMIKAVLGSVFSLRRPRDVFAGTSSGLKTVARGLGIGLAALVAQPYIGAKHGGAKGLVKGVGAGIGICAASTAGGVVVGGAQIVRGVANTPGAMIHKARGQVWNSDDRVWEKDWYSLPEEAAEVLGSNAGREGADGKSEEPSGATAGGASSSSPGRPSKRVVDRSKYDMLDVEPEASESQIRKAFYKKSLQFHPDKNPDNPEATQKFQAVSDAYRVLGDKDRRRIYDEHGTDPAIAGMPKIEPAIFFAALFGSHHFDKYLGRLRLAQEVDGDLEALLRDMVVCADDDVDPHTPDALKVKRAHDRMKVVQREREVKCAVSLAAILEEVASAPDADYDKALASWELDRRDEVEKLMEVPCGPEMLYLTGWVYANRARQFFVGGIMRRMIAKVEGKVHLTQSKAKLAGTIGRTAFRINGVVKKTEKSKGKNAQDKKSASDAMSSDEAKGASNGAPVEATTNATQETEATEFVAAAAAAVEVDETAATSGLETGQDSSSLLPGSLVMVRGLVGTPELNDEVGMVVNYDEQKDRYLVQLLSPSGGVKALKFENILLLQAPVETEGFCGAGQNGTSGTSGAAPSASSSSTAPGNGTSQDGQWAPGGDDAEMQNSFKECMPLFHDSLWSATSLDIELTLNAVVRKVLRDMSVDKSVLRKRAQVLLRLGLLFQEPMQKQRQKLKAERRSPAEPIEDTAASVSSRPSEVSASSKSSKRSILARFKPQGTWRRGKEVKHTQQAREADDKRKRMEGAIAMMAAGATTEDVDDMVAARAAMEAEFGEDQSFL